MVTKIKKQAECLQESRPCEVEDVLQGTHAIRKHEKPGRAYSSVAELLPTTSKALGLIPSGGWGDESTAGMWIIKFSLKYGSVQSASWERR